MLDDLTLIMLFVVNLISHWVHFYSIKYMYYDPHIIRFFAYLSLFTFFMLLLVLSDNLIVLFCG
jgi:NADH-quinone oxidoreductase subunit L